MGAKRRAAQTRVAESRLIRVEVRTIQGEKLQLQRDPCSAVIQLKREVAERWQHAPVMCQRLLSGTTPLADNAPLEAYLPPRGSATGSVGGDSAGFDGESDIFRLMLVVSLEDAKRRVADADWRIRREAILAFARVAPHGNKGALSTVATLLCDDAPEVRLASLQALASVAKYRDDHTRERALVALRDRLKDSEPAVRSEALRTMAEVTCGSSASDSQTAATLACTLLSDRHKSVSQEALRVLRSVAPQSGTLVVDAVVGYLRSPRPEVRILGLQAIVWAVGGAESELVERVIAAAGPLLQDSDSHVRQAAVWTFTQLLPDDQERAVALAVAHLYYGRADVRLGALRSLARDAPHNNPRALGALTECLRDQTKGLRLEALKVLAHLAPQGDSRCVAAVGECLGDGRPEVRLAALRLFPYVADDSGITRACAMDAAGVLLEDECTGVRRQAVNASRILARRSTDANLVHVTRGAAPAFTGDARRAACGSTSCPDIGASSGSVPLGCDGARPCSKFGSAGAVTQCHGARNPLFAAAGMLLVGGVR